MLINLGRGMLSGENQRAMKREHSGRPDYGQTNYERLHNNICIVFFYIPAFVYLFSLFGFSVSSRFFYYFFTQTRRIHVGFVYTYVIILNIFNTS